MPLFSRSCAASLLLCGLLLACGGGGGGDDSGGASAPAPNTPSPSDPSANYTGRTQQATVGDANATTLADAAWYGLLLVYTLGSDVIEDPLPDGSVDETIPGSLGGTLRVTGSINNGIGTLTIVYSNFSEGGVTYNGRESLQILQTRTSTSGSVRRTFEGLTIFAGGTTARVIGSITRIDSAGPVPGSGDLRWSFSGDLLFIDQGSNVQLRFAQISLSREPNEVHFEARFSELAGTARAYDSTHGYVDLAIESALRFKINTVDCAPGGSLAASGAANSKLWITPLSREYGAIELDTAGTGKPTRSLVYRWEEGFDHAPGSGGAPSATTARFLDVNDVRIGQPFTLEGRFSENSGGQFLLPTWSLELAPPGSTAMIVDENTTRAQFTPDVAGEYLFRLEVTDGTERSSDYLHVRAETTPVPMPTLPRVRVIIGPDVVVEPNTEVELDGRRTHATNGDPLQQEMWTVTNASSQGLELQSIGTQARFTTLPGQDYLARFSAMRQFSGEPAREEVRRIISPGNIRFAPAVAFGTRDTIPSSAPVTVADLDADDRLDLLQYAGFFGSGTAEMRIIGNRGSGRFERLPEVYLGGSGDSNARVFQILDVNGDELVDVVTSDLAGVGIFLQTSRTPLRFGTYTKLPRAADCGGFVATPPVWLIAADVDRDSDVDLVTNVPCGPDPFGRMEWYTGDSSAPSGFAPAVPLPLPGDARLLFVSGADLNGDGFTDLIGLENAGSFPVLAIWMGGANATFTSAGTLALGNVQIRPPLLIADLNLDDRPDFLAPTPNSARVGLQRPDGTFELQEDPPTSSGFFDGGFVGVFDFDLDGRVDLLGPSSWRQQLPDGRFTTQRRYLSAAAAAVVADLDGDSRFDLINGNGPSVMLQEH